jgi:hypothetical protein
MRVDPDVPFDELPTRARRRLAVGVVLRSLGVATLIIVGYFVLPMTNVNSSGLLVLLVGLVILVGLLSSQIRSISTSPYPRIRAIGALTISAPLFFVVFSTVYYLMDQAYPGSWTEPMTRLDAIYFTVTTFTTVGFGDITAVSQTARIVVTVQMLGGLVIVGLVARAFINAMQTGLQRREAIRRSRRR